MNEIRSEDFTFGGDVETFWGTNTRGEHERFWDSLCMRWT